MLILNGEFLMVFPYKFCYLDNFLQFWVYYSIYKQKLRGMKTFKVKDGKVTIDGVTYSDKPSEVKIVGKGGTIHSINIEGYGQFSPISVVS